MCTKITVSVESNLIPCFSHEFQGQGKYIRERGWLENIGLELRQKNVFLKCLLESEGQYV